MSEPEDLGGGWKSVPSKEWERLTHVANDARGWEAHTPPSAVAIVRDLCFFEHRQHYVVYSVEGGAGLVTEFLWEPLAPNGEADRPPILLDGKPAGIYQACVDSEDPLRLDDETGERTDEWLKFFCQVVHGDEGPFWILEPGTEVRLVAALESGKAPPADFLDSFELGLTTPEEEVGQGQIVESGRRRDGTVCYGGHLFRAEFLVGDTGRVEMLEDEPLVGEKIVDEVVSVSERICRGLWRRNRPDGEPWSSERQTITAAEFVRGLEGGRRYENVIVKGSVDLGGRTIESRIVLKWVTFRGPVDFSHATFLQGLECLHCVFMMPVDCSNIRIESGVLEFWGSEFVGKRIGGGARDTLDESETVLSLRGCHIAGRLSLGRVRCRGGSVDIAEARVDGALSLGGVVLAQGDLKLFWSRFQRVICLSPDESPKPAMINGTFNVAEAVVDGTVDLNGLHVVGYFWAVNSRFGALKLTCGAKARDDANSISASLEQVTEEGASHRATIPCPTRIDGGFLLNSVTVDSDANLGALQVTGLTAPESRTDGSGTRRWQRRTRGGLWLVGCKIGGDLVVSGRRVNPWADTDPTDPRPCASVRGSLRATACRVGGDIRLRDLHVGSAIVLDGTRAEGGIDLLGTIGQSHEVHKMSVVGDQAEDGRDLRVEATLGVTSCAYFSARRTTVGGSIDLTGLIVRESGAGFEGLDAPWVADQEAASEAFRPGGHVQLTGTKVEGAVVIGDAVRQSHPVGGAAVVPGALDLEGVQAKKLVLTGKHFTRHDPNASAADDGVVLTRSEFEEFALLEPLPVRVDLSNMVVGAWTFEDNDLARFELLLDADERKLRGTYTSIEAALTRSNRTEDAEVIRKSMWRAARQRGRLRRSRFKYWWLEKFGYGWPWASASAIVALILFLTCTLWNPGHVSPSLAYLGADGTRSPRAEFAGHEEFGGWDAFALSMRYGVPMLGLLTEQDWRATPYRGPWFEPPGDPENAALADNAEGETLGLGASVRLAAKGFSYEDIAAIVSLLAWLFWALFLLSLSGLTRRLGLSGPGS